MIVFSQGKCYLFYSHFLTKHAIQENLDDKSRAQEMPDLAVGNKKLNKHIQFQCEYSLRTEYIGSYAKYSVLHCFI